MCFKFASVDEASGLQQAASGWLTGGFLNGQGRKWCVTCSSMKIVPERPGDATAIRAVTQAAFIGHPHSRQTEAAIVDALRAANVLTVSLVAIDDGVLVGHVAFSPVTIDGADRGWFGLGPVSVAPEHQRSGVGSRLIKEGLEQLRIQGAGGCVVLGDPGYYGRFGFKPKKGLRYADAPPEYFQALAFDDDGAAGEVAYHAGFDAT